MTASLPSIPSAQPSAAPQAGAASPDVAEVPFSQVLSGELAQQQRRSESADDAAAAPADAAATAATQPGGTPAHRPDIKEDLQAAAPDQADAAPTLPDTMLALAMQPELVQRPAAPPPPAEQTAARPGLVAGAAPEAKTAARAAAGTAADPAAGRAARAAGTAVPSAAAAGTDDAHAAIDPAVPNEKTAVAEALAKRLPEPVRGAERLPEFAAALSAAQSAQPIAPTVAAAAGLHARDHLQPPVGAPAWNQALGDRIVWMAAGGQQSATLTLNPPDLGPMQIVLNVTNDQATAGFFAAQPEVRQALEAALPRLREMMQDAGIQLGQATVSADTPRQQDMRDSGPQRTAGGFADGNGADRGTEAALPPPTARAGRGLVDTFA